MSMDTVEYIYLNDDEIIRPSDEYCYPDCPGGYPVKWVKFCDYYQSKIGMTIASLKNERKRYNFVAITKFRRRVRVSQPKKYRRGM